MAEKDGQHRQDRQHGERNDRQEHQDQPGGEPACLLHLVCAECGAIAEQRPPTVCRRCGAAIEAA